MAIVSPPPELMTTVASQLLQAAADLGLPATSVATTSDGPLGLGFQVPDEVFERYQVAQDHPEPVAGMKAHDDPEVPEDAPAEPKKRGPGRPRRTDTEGSEV